MSKITRRLLLQASLLVLVLAFALYMAILAQESETMQGLVANYGYLGIFLASLASGFNIVVPVPAVAFMPLFLESGLSFWWSTAVMTLGMTSADALAYGLARTGRQIATGSFVQKETIAKLEKWKENHDRLPYVMLFFFAAFAPLPNETLVIPMAVLGYRFWIIMPIVLVANIVFVLGYSQIVLGIFGSI